MNGTKPLVSICCVTYNHENFICDAIDSFLMQKTTFPIEIIIHDDASRDKTPEIVKRYADKHPDLIVPIFQAENQLSKGVKIFSTYVLPKIRGKYIALCEGDDYWIDPFKLQKQFDYIKNDFEVSLCFHAVIKADQKTGREEIVRAERFLKNNYLEVQELLLSEWVHHTTSLLLLAEVLIKYKDFIELCPAGDIAFKLLASKHGKIGYIPDVMAVYRKNSDGSWSSKKRDLKFNYLWMKKYIKMLNAYNKLTDYKNTSLISIAKKRQRIGFIKRTLRYYLKKLGFFSTIQRLNTIRKIKMDNMVNMILII
jgi:glycosyltransferase involved in cell wall biosynthesis